MSQELIKELEEALAAIDNRARRHELDTIEDLRRDMVHIRARASAALAKAREALS